MTQPLTGYVLAGGKSSRMGRDKALLELGGRPLVAIAVEKLQAVCAEVAILSGNQALAPFAPLVPDLHPGCGPMGGMEAGLARAAHDWSLFLAVDMPFVPVEFLAEWVGRVLPLPLARLGLFTVDGVTQPALCLVHREMGPFLERTVERGEYKLLPVLQQAGMELAERMGAPLGSVVLDQAIAGNGLFANVNTPEEFAAAERLSSVGSKSGSGYLLQGEPQQQYDRGPWEPMRRAVNQRR